MQRQFLLAALSAVILCCSLLVPCANTAPAVLPGVTTTAAAQPTTDTTTTTTAGTTTTTAGTTTTTAGATTTTAGTTTSTVATSVVAINVTQIVVVNATATSLVPVPQSSTTAATEGSTMETTGEESTDESTMAATEGSTVEETEESTTESSTADTTWYASTTATANSTCADLRQDCNVNQCSDPHRQFLCATTCNTCDLRTGCSNAYGDSFCWYVDFLCDVLPAVSTVCKKSCGKCPPAPATPTPAPVTAANNCSDLVNDCMKMDNCSKDYNNIYCANTCQSCQDIYKCQDVMANSEICQWVQQKPSRCLSGSQYYPDANSRKGLTYYQLMCRKSCGVC